MKKPIYDSVRDTPVKKRYCANCKKEVGDDSTYSALFDGITKNKPSCSYECNKALGQVLGKKMSGIDAQKTQKKPEFYTAREFVSRDSSFMLRVTGRVGKHPAYSWELCRPSFPGQVKAGTGDLPTKRFFQVYTSNTLGATKITNPMNTLELAKIIQEAEAWILEQVLSK